MFYSVFNVLWLEETPIASFYDEPKNSLDVVYIGSSNVYAHFNTTLAFDLYGFATGLLSSDTQNPIFLKYLLKESVKTQNPKLYVIDIAKIADDLDIFVNANDRKQYDSMKFSKNRIDAINESLSLKKEKSDIKDYISNYFSFFMYHNRWKNLSKINFKGNETLFKGSLFAKSTAVISPQETNNWIEDTMPLQEKNKENLLQIIKYINDNKLNALFVIPIKCYDKEINMRINDAVKIIEKNNLKVINFNKINDEVGIDFSNDLYNEAHINVYGATKYTLYFSKYLKENYDLPDHRDDKKYNSWKTEYKKFKKQYKKLTKNNFDDLLKEYQK